MFFSAWEPTPHEQVFVMKIWWFCCVLNAAVGVDVAGADVHHSQNLPIKSLHQRYSDKPHSLDKSWDK